MLRLLARIVVVLVVAAAAVAATVYWWILQPLPLPVSPFAFDVKPGASLRSVARELAGAGVLPNGLPLVALARFRAVDRSIKAGNYEIVAGITLPRLLDKLTQGDVTQIALTIVEGSTFAELAAAFEANPAIVKTVLDLPEAELAEPDRTRGSERRRLVLPRHLFFRGGRAGSGAARPRASPDAPAARRGMGEARCGFAAQGSVRGADPGVDRRKGDGARRRPAADRLRVRQPASARHAAAIRSHGDLRAWRPVRRQPAPARPRGGYGVQHVHARRDCRPRRSRLPGQASLEAVVNPPQTAYLYFVARGDGTSEFSANLTDHNRAVARFQLGRR